MKFIEAYKKALDVILKKPIRLWGLSLLSALIVGLGYVLSLPTVLIGIIVAYLVSCGMAKVYLDGLKGEEVNSKQIFACFNKGFLRIAAGMGWQSLWLIIWGLIPVAGPVLAVIKSYEYRFVPYILITKPEVAPMEALKLSQKMTEGKKTQMFLADICFGAAIGVVSFVLGLLGAIPFVGILFILISIVFIIVVSALSGIFQGLYQASFYEQAEQPEVVAE